ncbi:hypothetical protein ZHAS_00002121 [Anopheles sinensis]|uniref:Uncharacterized protein n=1 Tax=Anopheles sinensis TaxID=74873 RepID=A0A084VBT3_ANOSI|nr:hypothetical protein ZHAS_00002121 [Anopheles sinensis]
MTAINQSAGLSFALRVRECNRGTDQVHRSVQITEAEMRPGLALIDRSSLRCEPHSKHSNPTGSIDPSIGAPRSPRAVIDKSCRTAYAIVPPANGKPATTIVIFPGFWFLFAIKNDSNERSQTSSPSSNMGGALN